MKAITVHGTPCGGSELISGAVRHSQEGRSHRDIELDGWYSVVNNRAVLDWSRYGDKAAGPTSALSAWTPAPTELLPPPQSEKLTYSVFELRIAYKERLVDKETTTVFWWRHSPGRLQKKLKGWKAFKKHCQDHYKLKDGRHLAFQVDSEPSKPWRAVFPHGEDALFFSRFIPNEDPTKALSSSGGRRARP